MTKTYEMLWDCGYCATRGLLGKSHRFCPSCGAPQDPTSRYFPAEADKVAVEDHVYVGADLVCANCRAPSAANAAHCPTCGAALGDDDVAATLVDAHPKDIGDNSDYARAAGAKSVVSTKTWVALVGVAAVVIVVVLVAVFWTKSAEYVVDGHTWERIIEIERYQASAGGAWCDQRPGDAYQVTQQRRQRGTRQVPDGEICHNVNVDRGDGTFIQRQQCQAQYRNEPVYAQWCSYVVDRWTRTHSEQASGRGQTPAPYWPQVRVDDCRRLGCSRQGTRQERYTVNMREIASASKNDSADAQVCEVSASTWRQMSLKSTWQGEAGALTGDLRCGSLRSPK